MSLAAAYVGAFLGSLALLGVLGRILLWPPRRERTVVVPPRDR